MIKKPLISFLLIFYLCIAGISQNHSFTLPGNILSADSLKFIQIKTDSLFNSNQIISLLAFPKHSADSFYVQLSYSKAVLKTTSAFAENSPAIAAINGSFFNRDSGGSVTFIEINDSVVSRTRNPSLKWGISDSIINGAIILGDDFQLSVQAAKSDAYYEKSAQESAVLVSGPVLLLNSTMLALAKKKFVTDRHPRTCLCLGETSVAFVTVDGRQQQAEGMSLLELQKFLRDLGCTEAINLDGGGSTTMWLRNKGIVNFPSDKSGERPVSNALLIFKGTH